jgi:hypothetical protein
MLIAKVIVNEENGIPLGEVEFLFDQNGLRELYERLEWIKRGETDHFHLMTEDWGGGELQVFPESKTEKLVHHVKVCLVPED